VRVGYAKGDSPCPNVSNACYGGFGESCRNLIGFNAVRIRAPVLELERIGSEQMRICFFKCTDVKELIDALPSRYVPVITAFWANVHPFFGFLTEYRCLTAGTTNPKSCWDTTFSVGEFVFCFFQSRFSHSN
jgi:hypothetical protein